MYVCVATSGVVRELSLERTHQRVKRAIHISNNKDVHKFVMDCTRFSDWQGLHSDLSNNIIFHEARTC